MEMGNTSENFILQASSKLFRYCSEIFIYFSDQSISKVCFNQMRNDSNQIKKPKAKTVPIHIHFWDRNTM